MIADAISTLARVTTTNSLTSSHVCGEGCSLLVVGIGAKQGAQDLTGITYAGLPLTKVIEQGRNDYVTDLWYLENPPSGTNNVVVTWSGNITEGAGGAVSFFDADSSVLDGYTNFSSGSGTISDNITPSRDDCVLVDVGWSDSSTAISVGAGQVQVANVSMGSAKVGVSYELVPTAGLTTMSWSGPSTDWAHCVGAFRGAILGGLMFIV